MKKIKTARLFTFKAYKVEVSEEVMNDTEKYLEFVKNIKDKNASMHTGSYVFKSDCEYYVEKNVLDIFNTTTDVKNAYVYLIYKISTVEDSDIDDSLIVSIYYSIKDEKIILD